DGSAPPPGRSWRSHRLSRAAGQCGHSDPGTVVALPAGGYAHVRPPLRMEGEDLQLDGQIDLTHVHARWHGEHDGREVEDAGDPGGDQTVTHSLRGRRGRGDHPD